MRKAGVGIVIGTTLVVGLAASIPHLSNWEGGDRPAVVQGSPPYIHPNDRHEEPPEDVRRLDRQKVNIATESIAVLQEAKGPEQGGQKNSERTQGIEFPLRVPPSPYVVPVNPRPLLLVLAVAAVVFSVIWLVRPIWINREWRDRITITLGSRADARRG